MVPAKTLLQPFFHNEQRFSLLHGLDLRVSADRAGHGPGIAPDPLSEEEP